MFDGSYHFQKVGNQIPNGRPYLERLLTFTFRTDPVSKRNKGHIYIVEVEKYNHNIYVIKYYPKRLKNSPKRFNILTGEKKCSKIVGTCLQIMLYILERDKFANFGFLGSNSYDPSTQKEESKSNTKRFRVYKRAMENTFGDENFTHFNDIESSVYIIMNNNNDNHETTVQQASDMFEYLFPDLE
ncbi:hypothetical protein GCM10023231_24690 [Olivibacter ginsenosidimutans]|uniref:Uncharacterized protein n=1 Tax=Olivibacter ginsenosidimutans TaxID=1176537 RepID=A0ABP9BH06_9SPHI